jgi:hypothetical protein
MIKFKVNAIIALLFSVSYFVTTSFITKYSNETLFVYSTVLFAIIFAINCLIDLLWYYFKKN